MATMTRRSWISESNWPGFSRAGLAVAAVMLCASLVIPGAGCSELHPMRGFDDSQRVQVQFYEPPGATVVVRRRPHGYYRAQVNESPDQQLEDGSAYAVFNLHPSEHPYPFAYTPQDGRGINIYGELEIYEPQSEAADEFVAQGFVPISLVSSREDAREVYYNPSRGNSGVGLSNLEMHHIEQGDVITRVYFVADLAAAKQTIKDIDAHIDRLRSAETVLNTHLEWIDARFQSYRRDALYADPTSDTLARAKDRSGANYEFIRLEADRQRLENERYKIRHQVDDLLTEQRMRKRMLDTMRIVTRRGSLVLATPEDQWAFHDTRDQIGGDRTYNGFATGPLDAYQTGDISIPAMGEPLVVMRVGGRHHHWKEVQPAPAESTGASDQMARWDSK